MRSGRIVPKQPLPRPCEANAIAGRVPRVRMDHPPPKHSLPLQTSFLHNADGAHVLYIRKCPDSPDGGLLQCPIHDFGKSFRHQTLSPKGPSKRIAIFELGVTNYPEIESADHVARRLKYHYIDARGFRLEAHLNVSLRVINTFMGPPRQIAGDFRVLSIAIENCLSIVAGYGSQG